MSKPPVIAYDARFSIGKYRGMGRFLRQLIAGKEKQLLGFCATGESDPSLNLIASGSKPYPLWEQFSLPRLIRKYGVDVFLAPYNTAPLRVPCRAGLVLVVHDLIFMERLPLSRSSYQNIGRLYRRLVVPSVVRRADMVVTVSNHTATQLESLLGLDASRLRVIPNSIGEEWLSESPRPRATRHYVLIVAGEAPSKNLSAALAAFARCRNLMGDFNLQLKVAGVKGKFHHLYRDKVRELGIAEDVEFLHFISDEEMRRLYREAELFVMPSLSEGFGIPVLEAMASGTPVAASAGTCLEEVGGEAARYFDATSIDDMAKTMREILSSPALQSKMSEMGRVQSRKFHPDVIRERICSFWQEVQSLPERKPSNAANHD